MGGVWPLNSSPSCRVKPCPHPPSTHPPSGSDAPSHHLQSLSSIACTLCNKHALGTHRCVHSVLCIVMIKSPSASGNLEGGSRRQSARTRKVTGRLLALPAHLRTFLACHPLLALAESLPRGRPPPRPSIFRGHLASLTLLTTTAVQATSNENYLQSSHSTCHSYFDTHQRVRSRPRCSQQISVGSVSS